MADGFDHNRAIRDAARSTLRPFGCVQKGQSRLWYADYFWWVGLIEFQPSGFSKGSYLNVGACFLWSDTDRFSFDDFAGTRPWRDASEGLPFDAAALDLARQGRDSLSELKARHSVVSATASWMHAQERLSNWGQFHAGIALALAGQTSMAQKHFKAAIVADNGIEWIENLNQECAMLIDLVTHEQAFLNWVAGRVTGTRKRLGLSPAQINKEAFFVGFQKPTESQS